MFINGGNPDLKISTNILPKFFAMLCVLMPTSAITALPEAAADLAECTGSLAPNEIHICLGEVARKCLEKVDRYDDMAAADCRQDETDAWGQMLDMAVRELSAKLTLLDETDPVLPTRSESFHNAQDTWQLAVFFECLTGRSLVLGGREKSMVKLECITPLMVDRLEQIQTKLEQ